jgi:hypothetical protein
METDRRQTARKRLNQLSYIRIGPDNGGLIADLGEGGLGFQTIAAIEREGPLRFWFTLDAADRIQATGELAWTDETRKVGGLRFTQISEEAVEQIRQWLDREGAPVEAAPPPRAPLRDPLRFSPPARKGKSAGVPLTSSPIPDEPVAIAPPLPPLPLPAPRPEPLRVMATPQHWSAPVLSAPPRAVVSPEMVRGATTGLTVLAVVLTLIGLVFGYHRELGQSLVRLGDKLTGESPLADAAPAPVPENAAAADAQQPLPAPSDPAAAAKPIDVAPQDPQPTSVAAQQPQSQSPAAPPSQHSTIASRRPRPSASTADFQNLSASTAPEDYGQLELDTARQFLEATNGPRKSAEAAKWLWMSVEKGNPAAEILLADLFVRGDGVTKSCSQARVLLAAAIKHGDSEAIRKLRTLDESGCR